MIFFRHKNAASIIEYTMLLVVLMSAIVVMRQYAVRSISGRWRSVGDSFGFGRQYDPKKTLECAFYPKANFWYEASCAESQNCDYDDEACYGECRNTRCD